jgi:hypothetical protein
MFSLKTFYPGGIRTRVFCFWGECDVQCATPYYVIKLFSGNWNRTRAMGGVTRQASTASWMSHDSRPRNFMKFPFPQKKVFGRFEILFDIYIFHSNTSFLVGLDLFLSQHSEFFFTYKEWRAKVLLKLLTQICLICNHGQIPCTI